LCEEGTEWREKDRHLPASSSLSYPYIKQTYSRLTTHTLDSLTDILTYNMAEHTKTYESGKSTKIPLPPLFPKLEGNSRNPAGYRRARKVLLLQQGPRPSNRPPFRMYRQSPPFRMYRQSLMVERKRCRALDHDHQRPTVRLRKPIPRERRLWPQSHPKGMRRLQHSQTTPTEDPPYSYTTRNHS